MMHNKLLFPDSPDDIIAVTELLAGIGKQRKKNWLVFLAQRGLISEQLQRHLFEYHGLKEV